MKLVVVESPYAGDIPRNVRYAQACMADCLKRGEAPYASHLLYTQPGVLRDEVADERRLGISAGFKWGERADIVAVYTDLGITEGMQQGIWRAQEWRQPVQYRTLGGIWAKPEREHIDERAEYEFSSNLEVLGRNREGIEVDDTGRQKPNFDQFRKGMWERIKTGEIDSEQGTSLAWKVLDGTQAGRLLNRKTISWAQYTAADRLAKIWFLSGFDQKVTPSYGESMGQAENAYGMARTELAHENRLRHREAWEVMGSTTIAVRGLPNPVVFNVAPIVEYMVIQQQDLTACGAMINRKVQGAPNWSRKQKWQRGKAAVELGLDRLVKHWDIRARER